jgi:hypothetical protein
MTRNTFAFAYGLFAIVTLVGASCKSDDPPPTIAAFCAQKADRDCGTATKGMAVNCVADLAACKATRAAICVAWAQTQVSATRPLRPENIENCLNKSSEAYAGLVVTPDKVAAMTDACNRVFSGNNKGEAKDPPCQSDYDCAAGLVCDQAYCVRKTVPGINGFCSDPGVVCPANQYCAAVGALKKCAPSAQAGEPCNAATPCADAFRCGSAGTCVAKATTNMACGSNADCAVEAPYCDPYRPTGCSCRPGFLADPGNPECATFGNTTSGTGTPMVCTGSPSGAGGTSGAAGAAGADGSAGAAGFAGSAGAAGGAGGAG